MLSVNSSALVGYLKYRPHIQTLSGLADTSWKAQLSTKEAAALAAELQARQALQVSLQDGNTPLSQVRVEDLVDSGGRPDQGAPEPTASPSYAQVASFSGPSGESARVQGMSQRGAWATSWAGRSSWRVRAPVGSSAGTTEPASRDLGGLTRRPGAWRRAARGRRPRRTIGGGRGPVKSGNSIENRRWLRRAISLQQRNVRNDRSVS